MPVPVARACGPCAPHPCRPYARPSVRKRVRSASSERPHAKGVGMGFRFFKSKSIAKGLRIGISKRGLSANIGGKGHSISLGSQGVFLNLSIPGTGISYRTKLGAPGSGPSKKSAGAAQAMPEGVQVVLMDDGTFEYRDQSGEPIRDQALVRRISALPEVKAKREELSAQYRQAQQEKAKQLNSQMDSFVDIASLSPKVRGRLWGGETSKDDPEAIMRGIDERIGSMTLPVEIAVSYELMGSELWVDLDLPELEDLPDKEYVTLASGALRQRSRTKEVLRGDYAKCVYGVSIFVAASLFDVSPDIERIVISGRTQRRDREGRMCDEYIISVRYTRPAFVAADFTSIDPEAFFLGFENRCLTTKTKLFKAIRPFDPHEE